MRALLIANPKATSTSRRARDVLVRAFAGDLQVDLAGTEHRGHASELARQAVDDDLDVIIALGGDGTVNEIVNGMLTQGPDAGLPALAVVPGGSANVFARTLGLSADPMRATGLILDALRAGRHRTVGLGRADSRYFTFCAGIGLDAEVVRAVERLRGAGARAGPSLYVRTALYQYFAITDRHDPALTLQRSGLIPIERMFLAIVSNTSPWTYLGRRPLDPNPRASFTKDLDVFALRKMDVVTMVRTLGQLMMPLPGPPRGRHVVSVHDATEFTVRSARPIAFQVDGDYLGERKCVTFRSAPRAIRVVI